MNTMKPLHWIILALLAAATLGLQLFGPEHPHPHAWDTIPLFYGVLGFVSGIVLIGAALGLARALARKPEDYYDRDS